MWLDRIDGGDKIFYTTGRLTSEMVIKAAQMGIPFLVSRSGLTQMGYEIAEKVGITMIGRATNKRYLLFTGARAVGAARRAARRDSPSRRAVPSAARRKPRVARCHVRPGALRRALSVALLLPLPLRELPARALRRLRHLDRVPVIAGDDRRGRR